jgi:methionyl-tRNA synthetase
MYIGNFGFAYIKNKRMKAYKRHLVTAALPYANGPVHIGHLAGNFLPADIYARYLRAKGEDVKFICGTDEHGVPITIRAMKEGVTPQDIVDKYHQIIDDSLKQMGISFDIFSRTSNQIHHETSQAFFKTLYDKGLFEEKESEQYFDEEKQTFLADRYITGTCPKCSNENAYGDQCEKCGSTLSPDELIHPKSTLSDSIPIKKKTTHWYLPLQNYESWLKQWIVEDHKEWKNNVYGQCKSWLDNGLQPRAMTRDSHWGVKVPIDGVTGKVLYVWFDAPIGYISATKELTNQWADYWCQEDTKLVHFLGKDNIVFHCIIFPAMLKAHGGFVLPDNVPANEFLNIEGEKVSTSRNWAVWVDEYVKDFPDMQDAMRYTLIANAPETKDNDFTWKDFQDRNNSELVAILGNFVNRAFVLMHKLCGGRVPAFHLEAKDDKDDALFEKIVNTKKQLEQSIEQYRYREALFTVIDLAREGNKYLQDKEPWKHTDNQLLVDNSLHLSLQLCANLAIYINPFLPFTAKKMCKLMKVVDKMLEWKNGGSLELLKVNYPLNPPELLFRKVEDEEIAFQKAKLENNKIQQVIEVAKTETAEPQITPLKNEIVFDDFEKIDLRVGKIIEAIKVPKADKLLQLTVDLGFEKRTVVSGIAAHYSPEEVIGKQVTLVANLAPRKMRGIESNGMILMAENAEGKLIFVNPSEEAVNGCSVR